MEVDLVEIPEMNTDAMVQFIYRIFMEALGQVREVAKFGAGDAMAAAMHLVVEAGLAHATPEQLRADLIVGIDKILADRAAAGKEVLN